MLIKKRVFKNIFGIIGIFSGAYYLFAELISVLFCADGMWAYLRHPISELGVPLESPADLFFDGYGYLINFSPMYALMNSAFIVSGIIFPLCFFVCFDDFKSVVLGTICRVLALLTGAGVVIVGVFHGYLPTVFTVHGLGATLCFVCGNILPFVMGLTYEGEGFKPFGVWGITLGAIGFTSAYFVLVMGINGFISYIALPERLAVYPIIIWQVLTGIYCLKSKA